jgi:hypothetical protein
MGRPCFYRRLPWGQELLINDHHGHSYTLGGASLGLWYQPCHRRISCQLVGVRITFKSLAQSRSKLWFLMLGSVYGVIVVCGRIFIDGFLGVVHPALLPSGWRGRRFTYRTLEDKEAATAVSPAASPTPTMSPLASLVDAGRAAQAAIARLPMWPFTEAKSAAGSPIR